MVNAVDRQFNRIILKKCFTQGNACTFPVQTIIYSMVAISAVLASRGLKISTRSITEAGREVRVFGDDIIVPSDALEMLTRYLGFLQLKVNPSKTFHKGRFRESCGVDAFAGVDVTPARIRSLSDHPSHEDAQSMLESANNLFMAGMWRTSDWMFSHLRAFQLPIEKTRDFQWDALRSKPEKAPTGRSILCFSGDSYSHLKKRWNTRLQREEYNFHRLVSSTKKVQTESAYDLAEFLFRPDSPRHPLDYLDPQLRGLGVVDKVASVMKRGWSQVSQSASTATVIHQT
jgi:hypothetical protein